MSEAQALSHLNWLQIHPILSLTIALVLLIFTILIVSYTIDKKVNPRTDLFGLAATTSVTTVVSTIISMIGLNTILTPSTEQINILRQSPISTISTQTVPLVSAQSASYSQINVHSSRYYLDANSNDTTSYRYFVKTNNGDYQIKTLSDTYGNVNSNDVYIHQQKNNDSSLVITTKQYTSPKVRLILNMYTAWSTKWNTYTFNVPENSINRTSDFK